jgi:hypothetical protein
MTIQVGSGVLTRNNSIVDRTYFHLDSESSPSIFIPLSLPTPGRMADFTAVRSLQRCFMWNLFRVSEYLEDCGIRHCIVGDAIITILGYPLVVFDLYLAVEDKQLEDAHAIVLQQSFTDTCGHDCFTDKRATDNPTGWPGYPPRAEVSEGDVLPIWV